MTQLCRRRSTALTRRRFIRAAGTGLCALPALFKLERVWAAADPPQAKIAVAGAYLRTAPALYAGVTQPVFANQQLAAVGRSADGLWIKLASTEANGWLLSQYAPVPGYTNLPVASDGNPAQPKAGPLSTTRFVTVPGNKAKKLYAAKAPSKDARLLSVIGDCNSVPEAYLGRLATGLFDASAYPNLAATIDRFAPSFARLSQAAFRGFNSGSMFSTEWANPNFCAPGEGPLACEMRRSRASVIVIALGTGDQFGWKDFEKNYRAIVEYITRASVLPVLMTKADDLDSQQGGAAPSFINDVVRRLGAEYGLPVIDFWAATRALPQYGMRNEGNENFHLSAAGSDLRILLTLQVLDGLWRK